MKITLDILLQLLYNIKLFKNKHKQLTGNDPTKSIKNYYNIISGEIKKVLIYNQKDISTDFQLYNERNLKNQIIDEWTKISNDKDKKILYKCQDKYGLYGQETEEIKVFIKKQESRNQLMKE